MAWTNWPPTIASKEQDYSRRIQIQKALREKHWATRYPTPQEPYPLLNVVFDEGVVEAVTLTSMTDSTKAWTVSPAKQWLTPTPCDVIFDDYEPGLVVRSHITDHTATVLTFDTIVDYITGNVIADVSSLVGKHYMIIKQGGYWYNQRWINCPNGQEIWRGTIKSGTTTTLTFYTDAAHFFKQRMNPNSPKVVGKELMTVGSDGRLHRVTITANGKDWIQFAEQSWTPVAEQRFAIVEPGATWIHLRNLVHPSVWYTGIYKDYWTIDPNGNLSLTPTAAINTTILVPDEFGDCEEVSRPAFDADVHTELDNTCDPDSLKAPWLHWSIRQWQLDAAAVAPLFVEAKGYSGFDGGGAIPNFTLATWFYKAGINAFTFTAGTYVGPQGYNTGVIPPYARATGVVWTALNPNGSIHLTGVGVVDEAGYLTGSGLDSGTDGNTIVYSYTWTRLVPRRVLYLYPKTCFIADWAVVPIDPDIPELGNKLIIYDNILGGVGIQDADPGAGRWIKRGASTTYGEYDDHGFMSETSETFVLNDLIRYVGDDWNDPTITPRDPYQLDDSGPSRPGGHAPDTPYWANFYRGKLPPSQQAYWDASMRGRSTSGTAYSLTDSSKNWWPAGVSRSETGTATAGSTTYLEDETKVGSHLWETARGRWNEFILIITKQTTGLVFKVPITATDEGLARLSFTAVPGLTVEVGDTYRIDEPRYELNHWQGRKLELTAPDGTITIVPILYSDQDTLYFAAQSFTVTAGWKYRIIEIPYGAVVKRTETEFVIAAGEDSRGQPFRRTPQNNMPNIVKRFGQAMKGDYDQFEGAATLEDELYRALNALRWTQQTLSWSSRADEDVSENNENDALNNIVGAAADWADAKSQADTNYDFYMPSGQSEVNGTAPYAKSQGEKRFDADPTMPTEIYASEARLYAYGVVTNIPNIMQSSVDFLNYAVMNFSVDGASHTDFAFESSGDPVQENKWTQWDTEGPDNDLYRKSIKLGSLDKPTWTPDPGDSTDSGPEYRPTYSFRGYSVINGVAIIKWDVDGGMIFID